MDERIRNLVSRMGEWEMDSPERIEHFLDVLAYSIVIGAVEGLSVDDIETVAASAIVHDVGIRPALKKYGNSSGPLQEKEGKELARQMLQDAGYTDKTAAHVAELVAHHHSYSPILGVDHQILIEADLIVNMKEQSGCAAKNAPHVINTTTGRMLWEDVLAGRA